MSPPTDFNFHAWELSAIPHWLWADPMLTIGTAIALLGLGIFGLSDLFRLSLTRIWAIAGVCYQESIRRRVLWIIPLAIIGLVIVVQLQQPVDEQDAIRQTTKFCLFATGMVVVISTIILACTNLPREIENRVIFTVVSKPTTRLEIIIGKIVGFARVSATILLIMGAFTYGYLNVRAWNLQRDLRERLRDNTVEAISRPTLQHYVDSGLLNAKRLALPNTMNIFAQAPQPQSHRKYPSADGMILVPFRLPADMWANVDPDGNQHPGMPGLRISLTMGYDLAPTHSAPTSAVSAPQQNAKLPQVTVLVMDQDVHNLIGAEIKGNPAVIPTADGSQPIYLDIPPNYAASIASHPFFFLAISGGSDDAKVWIDEDPAQPPVQLLVPVVSDDKKPAVVLPSDPVDPSRPGRFVFAGREGVTGQQIKGDPSASSQVCVFTYNNLKIDHGSNAVVPIEFRVGVEKSGEIRDEDTLTSASLTVVNSHTGKTSAPIIVTPENNHPCYASLPADAVGDGDFQVIVRCLSPEQWLNVKRASLSLVQSDESFALNLIKSSLVLWSLSILVTTISVFCSTFLSWPIAVILTLVMLLGRWGVNELGDSATAGIGRQIATDFQVRDPTQALVLSSTVEDLNKAMKMIVAVLPDIEQFSATEDIDRGISIPVQTLLNGAWVLLLFGVPLTVLAFVVFKNKEVAP